MADAGLQHKQIFGVSGPQTSKTYLVYNDNSCVADVGEHAHKLCAGRFSMSRLLLPQVLCRTQIIGKGLLSKCASDLSAGVQDAGYWQERFGVQRAPALVFLRGPGVAPAVFDTSNSKRLDVGKLASDNQWQVGTFFTFQSQQL